MKRSNSVWSLRRVTEGRWKPEGAFAGVTKDGELQVVQIPGSPGSRPGLSRVRRRARLPGWVALIPGLSTDHLKQPASEPGPSVSRHSMRITVGLRRPGPWPGAGAVTGRETVREADSVPRAGLELHGVSGRPGRLSQPAWGPRVTVSPGLRLVSARTNPSQPWPQACLGSELPSKSVDRVSGPGLIAELRPTHSARPGLV